MSDDGDGFTVEDPAEPAAAATPGKPPRPRRRDRLATLLSDGRVRLWRSPDGVAHASVRFPRHWEHMAVVSRGFRQWLLTAFYAEHGAALSGTAQAEAMNLAEARALCSGETRRTWRRIALEDGAVWLDLGGGDPEAERRAVRITRDGWKEVAPKEVVPAFLRAPDALPQVEPERDAARLGDLATFLSGIGEDHLALVAAWLVCALRPFDGGGAYPVPLLHGEQGSGKSGAARVLQALIDPSGLTGRSLPREDRDLFISAANRHLLAFDNVSSIADGFADCLCRIATGGGCSARTLHSDADETIFVAVKPLLLNGIPSGLLGRPDLADRALSIELKPLRERREEAAIAADFARMRPGLLGLLCDGIAAALRNLDTTKISNPPRMMDAATWAEAAAEGLGVEPGRIVTAWRANRGAADRAALEVNDIARAVVALLDEEEREGRGREWRGEPSELYRKLSDIAGERATRSRLWPSNAAGLGTALRRLAPGLRAVHGIEATPGKGGADGTRWWCVRRL